MGVFVHTLIIIMPGLNVLERGSIDNPLTFDVGLIQLSFIPVCSPNTCNISVKLREGLHFSAFHFLK